MSLSIYRALLIALVTIALFVLLICAADAQAIGAERWRGQIEIAADEADMDPDLLQALVQIESQGNPRAVSSAGAIGLGQLMPDTARRLGIDPWHPLDNLRGTARYYMALEMELGDMHLALAAYNAGPSTAASGNWPAETRAFVPRVLTEYQRIRGAVPSAPILPSLPRAGHGYSEGS